MTFYNETLIHVRLHAEDEATWVVVIIGALVAAYGIAINIVGFIGVGVIVSLAMGGIRINSERKKQRLEEVRHLNPILYQPLYEWVQSQSNFLLNPADVFFSNFFPSLNLETNIEYHTLRNKDLKKSVDNAISKQRKLSALQENLIREYNDRVRTAIDTLVPNLGYQMVEYQPVRKISQRDFDDLRLSIEGTTFVISTLVSRSKFTDFARQANNSSYHFLMSTAFPNGSLKCPHEILQVITHVDDLPSYKGYETSFNEYKDSLTELKKELEKTQRG